MGTRLTDQQAKILCAIQFHADAPVAMIRKKTGFRDHTIHYHLNRFKDEEVIRRATFINVNALGYSQYEIYFSLAAKDASVRERLLKSCSESPRVALYAELGGSFQYSMTVCAKNGQEMTEFLDDLAKRFGNIIVKKAVSLVVSFTLFRKKYLIPRCTWFDSMTRGEVGEQIEIDALDKKILTALFAAGQESIESVARTIREPRSTVDLRLKKLEEKRVILGYIYLINARKLGALTYRLLISSRGMSEGLRDKLLAYCAKHPNIVNISCCLGNWDFALTVEVEDPQAVVRVAEELNAAFAGALAEVEILPVFTQAQSKNYMRFAEPLEAAAVKRRVR